MTSKIICPPEADSERGVKKGVTFEGSLRALKMTFWRFLS